MKSGYTYYVQNAHGDVVNLTDTDGAVTKTYRYDAFGVELSPVTGDINVFRYCGEYFDTETGTIYLKARYYQASIGRFTQRDTVAGKLGDPLSLNLYTYAHNNPVFYFDPSGHSAGHHRGGSDYDNKFDEAYHVFQTGFKIAWASAKKAVDESVSTWTDTKVKPFIREQLITQRSALENMRSWMSENERTFSVGKSFTIGGGLSLYSVSQCYTIDTNGDFASQWSWNLGATSSSDGTLSYGYYYSITNAPSYDNLNDNGYSAGASALAPVYGPIGMGVGTDFIFIPGYDSDGREKGVQYTGVMNSFLIGTAGADIHGQTGMTYTTSSCHLGWLWNAYDTVYKRAMDWTGS